ncbi:MAG: molybdopterin-dependent oxidoreductase [Pirellulales bacterium]
MPHPLDIQLPAGQQLVARGKWPLVGEREPSHPSPARWTVAAEGLLAAPRQFTLDELGEMPQLEACIDIHCVTRWSKLAVPFRGVSLAALLAPLTPLPSAGFVSFVARSSRGHSTSLPLAEALELGALVALEAEGKPLSELHGGPVRMVVPGRYFYKSLKWLERIELLESDRLGYWESAAGYHNRADPWREQRYMAPGLNKLQMAKALGERDFAGKDLRSIDARGHDLERLDARGTKLRDADFRGCRLRGACFEGANLSNAHFEGADLRSASLAGADVEGANFMGADLRHANLAGASLLGVTFAAEAADEQGRRPAALVDATTLVERQAIDQLTPLQAAFLEQALATPPTDPK